jgi:C-3',4' desaturase CrtD
MQVYDYIVIGAGYGGLIAADLLCQQSKSVLVLEAHSELGGCASNFYRSAKGFSFDVGATTISGFDEPKSFGKALNKLGLKRQAQKYLKKLDIGMKVYYKDEIFNRYSDPELWLAENNRVFADEKIINLWRWIFKIEKQAWQALDMNEALMPNDFFGFMKMIFNKNFFANFQHLNLMPLLFSSFQKTLADFNVTNSDFVNFVDQQLLITAQNSYKQTPTLSAVMGLNYPQEVYYPLGSINQIANLIADDMLKHNGKLLTRTKVENIEKNNGLYSVYDNQGALYRAKALVANLPIWSLEKILNINSAKKKISNITQEFNNAWGAFTVYFAFKARLNLQTNYLQIHANKEISNCKTHLEHNGSIFVTLSEDNDRSPSGWTSVTISTHTHAQQWFDFSAENYKEQKQKTQDEILELLFTTIPELRNYEKTAFMSGTPKTFYKYTNRENGFVGGIKHDINKPIIFMPQQKFSSQEDIFLVGDTSFPGQGIAAVSYSALSFAQKQ